MSISSYELRDRVVEIKNNIYGLNISSEIGCVLHEMLEGLLDRILDDILEEKMRNEAELYVDGGD